MRTPISILAFLLLSVAAATAGPNAEARLLLHAVPHDPSNTCQTPAMQGYDDCTTETVTQVMPGADVDVYVFLENHTNASGIQVSFVWDASWTFIEWSGLCLQGQIDAEVPATSGDNYSNQFSCQTGGLAPLGRLHMTAGNAGTTLSVGDHGSGLTGVADCLGVELDGFEAGQRGVIAAGIPGTNPCNLTPVAATTWSRLKAAYR